MPGFFIAHGIAPDTYFEAGILIIGLVLTGNTLESRAKGQTAVALRKLVQMRPVFGLLLSPVIASAAMALSSFSVVTNSLRLRALKLS